ncbi:MAG: hypothetical protein AMXMBFR47_32540 [Planctomycetota bacterium]
MLALRFYDWLQSGPTPDCDEILAAGLEAADGPWFERIIGVLLQRGHEASWAALIGVLDRLPAEARAQLEAAPERIVNALARALKSPAAEARVQALRVFERFGRPRQLYLVADALRDAHPPAREAAACALRAHAAAFLKAQAERDRDGARIDAAVAAQMAEERRQIAVAVQEAARTFDLHHRVEALEASLWFADALGPDFWSLLHNTRSRAGKIVAERLSEWNRPAIAPFLLRALRHVAWRTQATNLLRRWTSLEHLLALLRCTDLLDHPEIRLQLSHVPAETCLGALGRDLSNIPESLQPALPRWVAALGAEPAWRVRVLGAWCGFPVEALRRSAVYALATIDHPDAEQILHGIAAGRGPLGRFAQWFLAGNEAGLSPRPESRRSRAASPPAPEPLHPSGASFPILWQACRRTPPRERGPLLEAIREHADGWRKRLRELLRSPDARDRLLVLQVIGTASLAPLFRHDLEQLRGDGVESIRKLAESVVASLHGDRADDRSENSEPDFDPDATGDSSAAHREYEALIRHLETDPEAATDPEFARKVRAALRRLRAESQTPAPPDASPAGGRA